MENINNDNEPIAYRLRSNKRKLDDQSYEMRKKLKIESNVDSIKIDDFKDILSIILSKIHSLPSYNDEYVEFIEDDPYDAEDELDEHDEDINYNQCIDCIKCNKCNKVNEKCDKCKKCKICLIPQGREIYLELIKDKYFNNLPKDQQIYYINLHSNLNMSNCNKIPQKYKLLDTQMSIQNKMVIMNKIKEFETLNEHSNEYHKLNKWINAVMKIPFGKYISLPHYVTREEQYNFLKNVNTTLNSEVYGHYDAKNKILQIIAQWLSDSNSVGNAIAIQGPPGIGKTSLIKNGLAKALNIPFNFIALSNINDVSLLEGHSYTYEGSMWGYIADILMNSGCMNPIIFFDELDKICDSSRGDEIISLLIHLVDKTQNNKFHDAYFAGIDIDLSRIFYIFSYNDESKVSKILRDRIMTIKLAGFDIRDKIEIVKKHIAPHVLSISTDIFLPDNVIEYIISKYTNEVGVRKLKECIETMFSKLNLLEYIGENKEIDIKYRLNKFENPLTITKDVATLLLETEYYHELENEEKKQYISKKENIPKLNHQDILTEERIINLSINATSKKIVLEKFREYVETHPKSSEFDKINKWISSILKIPFGKYINLPLYNYDSESNYLKYVNNVLDRSIFGQNNVKNKLLQIVAQWISNPNSIGNVIALYGPPGIGKTSIIKNGLAQALNIPFNFINLGGYQDSSILRGHSPTYIGATWGKIVEILMSSQCMNPIIYFDELDKVSGTEKGQEIINTLMYLVDPAQNDKFQDIYFTGVDIDLSRALFIFSYNHDYLIDAILKDRITKIKMDGYTIMEKVNIALEYLIPDICREIGISKNDIIFKPENIKCIINRYESEEKGVRGLRKRIFSICSKINLLRYINDKDIDIKYFFEVKFPMNITNDIIKKLLSDEFDMSIENPLVG